MKLEKILGKCYVRESNTTSNQSNYLSSGKMLHKSAIPMVPALLVSVLFESILLLMIFYHFCVRIPYFHSLSIGTYLYHVDLHYMKICGVLNVTVASTVHQMWPQQHKEYTAVHKTHILWCILYSIVTKRRKQKAEVQAREESLMNMFLRELAQCAVNPTQC